MLEERRTGEVVPSGAMQGLQLFL